VFNGSLQHRCRRGVTLIETIMVIVLLAAAAVTSSILLDGQWIARREVTAATNDVAAALIAARNTAITNRAAVRVRRLRNRGLEQLRITEDAGPFGTSKSWIIDLGGDLRLSGSPTEIQFLPTGTASNRLNWSIRQSRSLGRVQVAAASGQVNRQLP
jgi:prepilin-type N-terminal cleavage/methylation domain-containing protein